MAKARCYAIDPATGERCTLPQLAERYSLNDSTIRDRYNSGLRGKALVAPAHPGKRLAALASRRGTTQGRGSTGAMELSAMIDNALADPCNQWLTRPLAASA